MQRQKKSATKHSTNHSGRVMRIFARTASLSLMCAFLVQPVSFVLAETESGNPNSEIFSASPDFTDDTVVSDILPDSDTLVVGQVEDELLPVDTATNVPGVTFQGIQNTKSDAEQPPSFSDEQDSNLLTPEFNADIIVQHDDAAPDQENSADNDLELSIDIEGLLENVESEEPSVKPTDQVSDEIPETNEGDITGSDFKSPPIHTGEATTSTAVLPEEDHKEPVVLGIAYNDENRYSFSKNECVHVGDGSFYCTSAEKHSVPAGIDRVFSAPDAAGDHEIYIERSGVLTQITNNDYDDSGPYYDPVSNSIVWHRLIEGRYQIITFDLTEGVEHQLTFDRFNNMEPSRYDDVIVWQAWIGSDWEVVLSKDGELTLLTDNAYHDVSPRINGNYIVWQSFESDTWQVKVYDRTTQLTDTIGNAEGGSVNNPRFVLVYDAVQANGDTVTHGYDLQSRKSVPLSATPASVPTKIPDPERTGEERALVQPQIQIKSKSEITSSPGTSDGPVSDEGIFLEPDDLVVTQPVGGFATSSTDHNSSEFADAASTTPLVVAEYTSAPDIVIDHIEDLVVSPYSDSTHLETDSQ